MSCRLIICALAALLVAACGTAPKEGAVDGQKGPISKTPTRKPTVVLKKGGGFYKDDGPADDIPDGLDDIPDAQPRWEPLHKPATKPYVVLGKEYIPNTAVKPYKVRGIASWYGKKFHGQKTSIGEPYDMFAMTAAHPTLALPSYVRVTSVQTGRAVVVRVTDRGPFHADRVIDLSYTAAYKLDLINGGSGQVEVEAIIPGEPTGTSYSQMGAPMRLAPERTASASPIERCWKASRAVVANSGTSIEASPTKSVTTCSTLIWAKNAGRSRSSSAALRASISGPGSSRCAPAPRSVA